jgi:putative ABC transport system permease protein
MILGQGMALALIGVAIGLFGALWLTRLLQQLLFEPAPTNPLTYGGVAVVLGMAALVGCYVPARRAARVDPIVALRGVTGLATMNAQCWSQLVVSVKL